MIVIDGYRIDVATSTELTYDTEVTEFPIEKGADVADHIRDKPNVLTIEGIVSNSPIGEIAILRGTDAIPADDFFAHLKHIKAAREPVVVDTSRERHASMVLKTLSLPSDSSTGDALKFRAVFRQITRVDTERSFVQVTLPRAKRKRNRGHVAAKTAGDSGKKGADTVKAVQRESLWVQLVKKVT